jgi:hypothetical protein
MKLHSVSTLPNHKFLQQVFKKLLISTLGRYRRSIISQDVRLVQDLQAADSQTSLVDRSVRHTRSFIIKYYHLLEKIEGE